MKWYSVKKYKPMTSTTCLIFTENNICYAARLESIDTPDVWIHDYYCEDCQESSYEKIYGVTHFCVPDPVEIDD
jgi:hypothetical protein